MLLYFDLAIFIFVLMRDPKMCLEWSSLAHIEQIFKLPA